MPFPPWNVYPISNKKEYFCRYVLSLVNRKHALVTQLYQCTILTNRHIEEMDGVLLCPWFGEQNRKGWCVREDKKEMAFANMYGIHVNCISFLLYILFLLHVYFSYKH